MFCLLVELVAVLPQVSTSLPRTERHELEGSKPAGQQQRKAQLQEDGLVSSLRNSSRLVPSRCRPVLSDLQSQNKSRLPACFRCCVEITVRLINAVSLRFCFLVQFVERNVVSQCSAEGWFVDSLGMVVSVKCVALFREFEFPT